MNVSLKEFQRLVTDRAGKPYIFIYSDGARLSIQLHEKLNDGSPIQFCYLATSLNRCRTFKTISALHRFLTDNIPGVIFSSIAS